MAATLESACTPEVRPPEEGILPGRCPYCGMEGEHPDREACIDALRSELGSLEFRLDAARRRQQEAEVRARKLMRQAGGAE